MIYKLENNSAKNLWLDAQGLNRLKPFGAGPSAVSKAVDHLGYVQIDTISVIERCHHHILYSRIPGYTQQHLVNAQSKEKSIFEYWTHALAYVPTKDYRFFQNRMAHAKAFPNKWFENVKQDDLKKLLQQIKKTGAISIRDIKDDILVEKDHDWASKKPSKRVLQYGFNCGDLVISERLGMLKKYELTNRHFNWEKRPKAASPNEVLNYQLDRALKAQSIVSLDSICHLEPKLKPNMLKIIETRLKANELISVGLSHAGKQQHWIRKEDMDKKISVSSDQVHVLSPFDPLIIQRKRLKLFFDYDHIFEAYVPKHKRKFGYFALPVLVNNEIVAAIDLKTDRQNNKLLIQQWSWMGKFRSASLKKSIETELNHFEKFQLQK